MPSGCDAGLRFQDDMVNLEKIGPERGDGIPMSRQSICVMACGFGGLQVVWATIFSNGNLYLSALDVPDTWTSLVWAMPAVCGCVVQPIIGTYSDMFSHPWGRRRPFMVIGAIGVTLSIAVLAWAEDLARFIASMLSMNTNISEANTLSKALAVLSICTLSLTIQPLQCALRSIMLDQCPATQQAQAQSWTTRFSGVGQILGCIAGLVYLPGIDALGEVATFRILAVVSILAVDSTVLITCLGVREASNASCSDNAGRLRVSGILTHLWRTLIETPSTVRKVFYVQFLAWSGWFCFLFYNTSYINQLYASQAGTRSVNISGFIGSLVTLVFSCISFATSALLPLVVEQTGHFKGASASIDRHCNNSQVSFSTYLILWSSALGLSATLMFSTALTRDVYITTALIAINGISWAVANWLPFALIGLATAEEECTGALVDENGDVSIKSMSTTSGAITGIHNVAISAPQIFAAGICSIILRLARQADSHHVGAGWVLQGGGVAFFAASGLALRLAVRNTAV